MEILVERYKPQDEDQSAHDAASTRPGHPIRVRLQPQLYFGAGHFRGRKGAFYAWRNVFWNVRCGTVEDAIGLKNVLQRLFAVMSRDGISALSNWLDIQEMRAVQSAPSTPATAASTTQQTQT